MGSMMTIHPMDTMDSRFQESPPQQFFPSPLKQEPTKEVMQPASVDMRDLKYIQSVEAMNLEKLIF